MFIPPSVLLYFSVRKFPCLTCTNYILTSGVFQGKRRKELGKQISDKEQQIETPKQRLRDIVKGHGYSSVDEFMRVYRKVEADYADYSKRLKAWGDKYGMKYVKQRFEEKEKSYLYNSTDVKTSVKFISNQLQLVFWT